LVISITQAAARALAETQRRRETHSRRVWFTIPLWTARADKDLLKTLAREIRGSRFNGSRGFSSAGRAAQPEDIVPTALFLASSDSDYVTGQTVAIDGGTIRGCSQNLTISTERHIIDNGNVREPIRLTGNSASISTSSRADGDLSS